MKILFFSNELRAASIPTIIWTSPGYDEIKTQVEETAFLVRPQKRENEREREQENGKEKERRGEKECERQIRDTERYKERERERECVCVCVRERERKLHNLVHVINKRK